MRVLFTGGNGFIGKNIVPLLRHDHTVFAPPSADLDVLDAIALRSFISSYRIEVIVHAAAVGVSGPGSDVLERNVRMSENVLSCAPFVGRIVLFGSGAEYDKSKPIVRAREEDAACADPLDDYGRSKLAISRRAAGIPNAVVLRIFGVFGPHEDISRRFISMAILDALRGDPITIRQDVVFSYLWVRDLAPIVDHMLTSETAQGAYNVVPDETVTLTQIARIVNSVASAPVEVRVLTPGLNKEYSGDNARLRAEMPDVRFTPLPDAIRILMERYRTDGPVG